MKIFFIDPPRFHTRTVRVSRMKYPDIGLGYLASYMERNRHEIRLLDGIAESFTLANIRTQIEEFNPDVIGFALFTHKVFDAEEIARQAKEINPKVRIVAGGAHATALPRRTLLEFSHIDFVVSGEGELTLNELISAFEQEKNGDFSNIKGLTWKSADGIVRNPNREIIKDLDALPFPEWSVFPLNRYRTMYSANRQSLELPVIASRGCRGRCWFCFRLTGGRVRRRTPRNVLEEIQRNIREYNAKQIIFFDTAFTSDQDFTKALCREFQEARLPDVVTWVCETRVDTVDPYILKLLKQSGCTHISYGVESGSQKVLDSNNKKTTVKQACEAVRWAKEAGLQVDVNFILGLPYETRETLKQTRSLALQMDSDFASFFTFTPYPGTVAMKLAREGKAGLKLLSSDWSLYEIHSGRAAELHNFSIRELERFQFVTYLMYYLRPKKWGNLLKMIGLKSLPGLALRILAGRW